MRLYVLLLCVLCACEQDAIILHLPKCAAETATQRAEFILTCAKNANPMSDEEGEDLVRQCEYTSINLYSPVVPYASIDFDRIPCDEAMDTIRKAACEGVKK